GRLVTDPGRLVVPERARIALDEEPQLRAAWRTILLHKPRGVVTTRRDPEGRRTVFDVVGEEAGRLNAAGRLDLATSGLLLLTTDTQFANWITDPVNAVARVYIVAVRGLVTPEELARLDAEVTLRKSSSRESHLTVSLRRGRNREVRRLFEAIDHEGTTLKRGSFGGAGVGLLQARPGRGVPRAGPGAGVSRPRSNPRALRPPS